MKICQNCVYFMPAEDDKEFGTCRRYAPKPLTRTAEIDWTDSRYVKWADVHFDYWCGEFEKGGD